MKPNFALNLSHEGISLLHRAKAGWMPVGDVRLDDPDLNTRLDMLRKTAAGLEQGGISCKLVIPNSQILYTDMQVKATGDAAREKEIRKGLRGLTPYDVEDLVFDWRAVGPRVQVAVVARETLKEAEAFATEFRFNPVSFVGVPDPDLFDGEPFFGPTEQAEKILGNGESVEPDEEAIRLIEPGRMARPKAAAAKEMPADGPAPAPEPKAGPKTGPDQNRPGKSGDKKATEKKARDKVAASGPATTAPGIAEPSPDAPVRKQPASNPEAETKAETEAEAEDTGPIPVPITFSSRRRTAPPPQRKVPVGPASAPGAPDSAPRHSAADDDTRAQIARYSALDVDDIPEMPAWRRVNGKTGGAVTPMAVTAAHTADPLPSGGEIPDARPGGSGGSGGSGRPGGLGGSAGGRIAGAVAGVMSGPLDRVGQATAGMRRAHGSTEPPALPPRQAGAIGAFAGRPDKPRSASGRRTAGLAVTALLLATLGSVALWSALFPGGDAPAPVLDPEPGPGEIAALEPARPAPAPTAEIGPEADSTSPALAAPTQGAGLDAPRTPLAESAPPRANGIEAALSEALVDGPAPEAALPRTAPAPALSDSAGDTGPETEPGAPAQTGETDLARLEEPATASPSVLNSPPPDRITQPPPTRAEAERRYASSGIWQLDPEAPAEPRSEGGLEKIVVASADPQVSLRAFSDLPGAGPDSRPPSQFPPPPLGLTFELDERGLVRASPEGTLSPEGVVVYLGQPPVVPGIRPGTQVPQGEAVTPVPTAPEQPAAEAPTTEEDAPPALTPEQERLRQFRPVPRPASLEETFDTAPTGGFTQSELALIRPQPRPPSVQEEAAADDPTLQDDADQGTELAVASSAMPRPRPASMSQAVQKALAEARETPQTPDEKVQDNPQVAAAVVPDTPARASVARAATEKKAIQLGKINLIGVYGSPSDRRALVRLKSGRYVKVEVGDRIDGGRVAAIGDNELRYVKGGRNITLKIAGG